MLFLKSKGTTLNVADWTRLWDRKMASRSRIRWPRRPRDVEGDCNRGVPYAKAFQEIEKRVLEAAIRMEGPRREIAHRLGTSERTLYYKIRAHGLGVTESADGPMKCARALQQPDGALQFSAVPDHGTETDGNFF